MTVRVSRWGNSLGVRLPKMAIETLELKDDDTVELSMAGKVITLTPARLTLEKIFSGFPEGEAFDSYDWGEMDAPAGRELL